MNIRIYQVNMDRDSEKHNVAFMNYESLKKFQGTQDIDSEIYNKVFDGEVECKDLEDVFEMFNTNHPKGYRGRSLSVSDVVEIVGEQSTFHFCDSFGFQDVDFDSTLAGKMEEPKIKVVLLEPGKQAQITEIDSTLEGMQAVVGGDIQPIYPFEEEVCIVCDEEGKLKDYELNRALYAEPEEEYMPYEFMEQKFREKEKDGTGKHIMGYVVFSNDSFDKEYPIEARTYCISSNNKAFQPGMCGYSIYGSSLDGSDVCVRLEQYMRGENAWKIEDCYMKPERGEMFDILAGKAFICSCAGENFGSLSDEQAKRYQKQFQYPEAFARINGEIIAVPVKDTKYRDER